MRACRGEIHTHTHVYLRKSKNCAEIGINYTIVNKTPLVYVNYYQFQWRNTRQNHAGFVTIIQSISM